MPNTLQTEVGDRVHFQWTGSDYNPRRGCNNGEGGPPDPKDDVNAAKQNSRADRSNLVLMNLVGENLPTKVSATTVGADGTCLLYTSPSPRDATLSRMPSSA